jgi:transposase
MRKLEISDAEIVQRTIQQEIMKDEESRYNHRLHGLLLICKGFSCYEVADIMGHSPRTVEYWVQNFEKHGFTGLSDNPRPGRPPVLTEDIQQGIAHDLRTDPGEFGYPQTMWDGKLLSHHLLSVYQVTLGVRQCQRWFKKLGFRRRKPRPVIANADPDLQRAYKKTQ